MEYIMDFDIDSLLENRKSWPFKIMGVGEHKVFRATEVNLVRAAAAARAYAHASGKTFRTAKVDIEGVPCLVVKRFADSASKGAQEREDGRSARRVYYGYEDLEVGEEKLYLDGSVEARKAVSGIYNRQRETGKQWTTRRVTRVIRENGIEVNEGYIAIKRKS